MDEMDDEIERVRQAADDMARLMGGRFVLSPWKLAALREATHAAAPISDNRVCGS